MAGTLGSFYVGVSGLQSSQYALNATSHNITNAGTEGYSRQQVMLSDLGYTNLGNTYIGKKQAGLGTKISDVRVVRDRFVDVLYRKELSREQYYQNRYDVINEVQNFFGELEGSQFRNYMQNLWQSAQELQKESNSIVTRSAYLANAVAFIDEANEISEQLKTYQKNLDENVKDQVKQINDLADQIYDLNYKITMVEASKIESANDYRDQLNHCLDQLSSLISITYHENATGQVDVYAEGRTLVSMDRVYHMSTRECGEIAREHPTEYTIKQKQCDFLIPVWEDDQDLVFNLHKVPCTEDKTDMGSLKAIVMSRGDWVANYLDIPVAPEVPIKPVRDSYETDAEYNAALTQYQTDYADYQTKYQEFTTKKEYYNTYLEPYTVNNIIAQFDQLVHGIVTRINDILCPNKEITLDDGSVIKVLDEEKAGYGMGESNRVQGVELIERPLTPRYTEKTVTLAGGTTTTVKAYNEEDPDDPLTLYNLGNLKVNDELIKNPSLMSLSNLEHEELQEVANLLVTMWNEDFASLGPNSLVSNDFMGYYKEFIGDFANKGMTYNGIAETQQQAVLEADSQRQSVLGVSTDEELSNMIRFQQGFNAASRYFTVVSEMVEHLINKLG